MSFTLVVTTMAAAAGVSISQTSYYPFVDEKQCVFAKLAVDQHSNGVKTECLPTQRVKRAQVLWLVAGYSNCGDAAYRD